MQIKKHFSKSLFLFFILFQLIHLFAEQNEVDPVWFQSSALFIGEEAFSQKIDKLREEREPLALVLSGGSARAYAHIGVLRELEKANIKPDFIVANSMGAIIGLLYASGFSPDDIEAIVTQVDLNSFFDIVFPLRGGILSSRYFLESLSRLFPNKNFDIKDSFIPIIVPTEDLYTKRQVLFAEGEITKIMAASFAMSFMMEPVPYLLESGQNLSLVDSGSIDLGSLKIAKRFTDNIIISTALYDTKLNLNNPVTVLNRTFSIGKERQLVQDILDFEPHLIRNDVEQFSFMDFTKVHEIIGRGEMSTKAFLNAKPEIVHGNFPPDEDVGFQSLRSERQKSAALFIEEIQRGRKPTSNLPYLGLKIRPNVAVIDFSEFLLAPEPTIGAYAFFDFGPFFTRAGAHTNIFNSFGGDFFSSLHFSSGFETKLSYNYRSPYGDLNQASHYVGLGLSWTFSPLKQVFFKSLFTAELLSDADFREKALFSQLGFSLFNTKDKPYQFSIEPSVFYNTAKLSPEFTKNNLGLTLSFFSKVHPFSKLGFSLTQLMRYTPFAEEAVLFYNDGFRAIYDYSSQANKNSIALSQLNLYWYTKNTGFTAMEAFKLEALSLGLFTDALYDFSFQNHPLFIVGLFSKQEISLAGLSSFNLETSVGWDFEHTQPKASLRFVSQF
ncbi:MAG TPA: patatin-like phospholipase family protein [Treponemataceae bacterium]|nr:patatin-like phospholipase family protein [Treponemataceae bacterium]